MALLKLISVTTAILVMLPSTEVSAGTASEATKRAIKAAAAALQRAPTPKVPVARVAPPAAKVPSTTDKLKSFGGQVMEKTGEKAVERAAEPYQECIKNGHTPSLQGKCPQR